MHGTEIIDWHYLSGPLSFPSAIQIFPLLPTNFFTVWSVKGVKKVCFTNHGFPYYAKFKKIMQNICMLLKKFGYFKYFVLY